MGTMLSVIIPAYNEKETIEEIIKRVNDAEISGFEKEIIVVDDFSRDGTREILERIDLKNLKKYYHEKNMGKGAAVKTGISNAKGDVVIIQDADLEYCPEDYPALLKPIMENRADVVYGSRFLGKRWDGTFLLHYIGNRFLSFSTNALYNSKITDMETCYKVFRKSVVNGIKITSRRFEFEPEITAKILKNGHKILEVPISYEGRNYKAGKKITALDGLKAFWVLLKYRFAD